MAATPKGTVGSCADKWIIIGRTQEYSAHHVCNPPMGAAGPIVAVGPWSMCRCILNRRPKFRPKLLNILALFRPQMVQTSADSEPEVLCKMADGQLSNCVGDGDKQQSSADIENLTQYVNYHDDVVFQHLQIISRSGSG